MTTTDVFEARHVIEVDDNGWTLEHPFACRAGGKRLLDCEVHELLELLDDPHERMDPGRYKVTLAEPHEYDPTGVGFEALDPDESEPPLLAGAITAEEADWLEASLNYTAKARLYEGDKEVLYALRRKLIGR